MPQISHLVRIRATPEMVFQRVGTAAGIEEWFTEAASPDYSKGGTLELRFGDEPVAFTITEFAQPTRIAWHCTTQGNSWCDTDIIFEFEAQGDRTVVRFDHLGWPEVTDRFRDCSASWVYFLESLRSLLEEGRGTPESVAPPCEGTSAD
jgi:uncharacterized protein YndB with AHSA1/START domain